MAKPKRIQGTLDKMYDESYRGAGVSYGEFLKFTSLSYFGALFTFVGVSFTLGLGAGLIALFALCIWGTINDPATKARKRRKAEQAAAQLEDKIRLDERQRIGALMGSYQSGRETLPAAQREVIEQ